MNKQEEVMAGFRTLFNKMAWLNKSKMEEKLSAFKSSEVHCIEFVGSHRDVNVTKLAEAFYMTSGAMSKVTKKLMQRGILESYQKPENKKEIYFRLTEQGQSVYRIHEALHREFEERDQAVFEHVTEEQFNSMLHFVEAYNTHLDAELNRLKTPTKTE